MGAKPIGYSASRVSAIIDLNPYKTPVHAYQEIKEEQEPGFNARMGYTLPEPPDNAAIRWGHAFEDAIIKLAEEREGRQIQFKEKYYSKKYKNVELTCHIDGGFNNDLWFKPEDYNNLPCSFDTDVIHEGKTTNVRAYHNIKDDKCRWGEPGTDQVPEEYQVQTAVQRICTGAELVKLSVLVFPKVVDEWEAEGWLVNENGQLFKANMKTGPHGKFEHVSPYDWAQPLAQMGYFHTYNLPSHPALEKAIIEAVQIFDANNVKPGIPPEARDYDDIRRLLTNPIGTLIATPEIKAQSLEYSEITRQIGASGPMARRKGLLKIAIMNWVMKTGRADWAEPYDRVIVVDPNGGEILVNFLTSGFRTKRAK